MVLMRGIDRFQVGRDAPGVAPSAAAGRAGAAGATAGGDPGRRALPTLPVWAVAAVAAYLDTERDVDGNSATAWTSRAAR
jgi:hypothetical protein